MILYIGYLIFFKLLSFFILWIFDILIAKKFNNSSRWFCLHAFGNFLVVLSSLKGFILSLTDPINSNNTLIEANKNFIGYYSTIPTCMIATIHIYHSVMFKLTKEDLFHHLTFVPIIILLGTAIDWGPNLHMIAMLICGLPGMLDYIFLLSYKEKLISKLLFKKISYLINLIIRCPFIIINVYNIYLGILYEKINAPKIICFLIMFLFSFNALYYLNSSIRSHERLLIKKK